MIKCDKSVNKKLHASIVAAAHSDCMQKMSLFTVRLSCLVFNGGICFYVLEITQLGVACGS